MDTVLLAVVVVAVVVVGTPLADRLRVPSPVLLTVAGLAIPLAPGVPALTFDPDLILPVVLPPLLFAATQRSTVGEFAANWRPILLLAVGLTVASAAGAAAVAHLHGLGWAPALVLGAVVAPPDPVAATAVARRLRLPHRLVTVLEGEGMFNDATALVLYGVTVAAVVSGSVGPGEVGLRLLLAVVLGVLVGLAAGWLSRLALGLLHDASAETTVTLAVPFLAYLVAEEVHGSGVLAVLTLGLFLRSYGHPVITAGGWLLGRAVWRYADYLVTSLVFVLIGFELTAVLEASRPGSAVVELAAWVVGTLIVIRFAWLYPAAVLARAWQRRRNTAAPYGARETLVAAWAGMRGVVTIATALALPLTTDAGAPFPGRDEIVVVGLGCVLVTLVAQGLTLSPLVTWLGVGEDQDTDAAVTSLRRRAAERALDAVGTTEGVPESVHRAVVQQYESYLAAIDALSGVRRPGAEHGAARPADPAALDRLLGEAMEVERSVVLEARRTGECSSEVADAALASIESRVVRDLG